jgi:hypothetical protein
MFTLSKFLSENFTYNVGWPQRGGLLVMYLGGLGDRFGWSCQMSVVHQWSRVAEDWDGCCPQEHFWDKLQQHQRSTWSVHKQPPKPSKSMSIMRVGLLSSSSSGCSTLRLPFVGSSVNLSCLSLHELDVVQKLNINLILIIHFF